MPDVAVPGGLRVWGGVECTVNRVGARYHDQVERTGHAFRISDLDLFAGLGVEAIRYPVLWERTMPGPGPPDWSWSDQRLARLRTLGIEPIVGLLHHGSGPPHTSLLDPGFPEKLAEYAGCVAGRYPWVRRYTPVNEPLSTARFSCLYGHWYPHRRDPMSFARALLNELRGIVLSMRAIRQVNPAAQLVQTDDAGRVYSTPAIAYQAEFENERRWLTLDLLCGRLDRRRPMWSYLTWLGIGEAELEWFAKNPCPPQVVGLNYYLTSDRFLDHRTRLYPRDRWGRNDKEPYADLEAVRTREEGIAGIREALNELWQRYHLPLAVTEVHNGCTREEQLRWLVEIWDGAQQARAGGAGVEAVTVWSLLGAYDWDSLVTRERGHYEPGVFDASGPVPRPTALEGAVRALAAGARPWHAAVRGEGWWRRPTRLIYSFAVDRNGDIMPPAAVSRSERTTTAPVLITGASGTLGRAFARMCRQRGLAYRLLGRNQMDIADAVSVRAAIQRFRPWAVVNAAGCVRVDDSETDQARCYRDNATGPAVLAGICAESGVRMVTYSSDLVFDGERRRPYLESDRVAPLSIYGRSKAEAEVRVLTALPDALVIRTSAFFGPWDEYNFVVSVIRRIAAGGEVRAACDAVVSPTYVPDLVNTSLDLLIDGESGLWHLANDGAVTWYDLARETAGRAGLDPGRISAHTTAELGHAAARPLYSVLATERGATLPNLDGALGRFFQELDQAGLTVSIR